MEELSNPLWYVSTWDFAILSISMMFRLCVILKIKSTSIDGFMLSKYFDLKQTFRWLVHVFSSVLGILVLPQVFVEYIQPKYMPDIPAWTMFGSAVVGFLGYDLVRFIEKVVVRIMKSKGV